MHLIFCTQGKQMHQYLPDSMKGFLALIFFPQLKSKVCHSLTRVDRHVDNHSFFNAGLHTHTPTHTFQFVVAWTQ